MALSVEEVVGMLGEEDFLDIIEGKKIEGIKITKEMKKEIKFAMKRGCKAPELRKLLTGQGSSGHTTLVRL